MPATTKQRTLVWAGVLVYLIYLVASDWHSLRHGMFSFPPSFGLMLLLLVIGAHGTSTGRCWVEVLIWAAISALVLSIITRFAATVPANPFGENIGGRTSFRLGQFIERSPSIINARSTGFELLGWARRPAPYFCTNT